MPKAKVLGVVVLVAVAIGLLLLLVPRTSARLGPESSSAPSASAASVASRDAWVPRRIAKVDMHTHIEPDVTKPAREFLESHGIGRAVNLSGGYVGEGGLE